MIKEHFQELYNAALAAREAGTTLSVYFQDTHQEGNPVVNILTRDYESTKASASRAALLEKPRKTVTAEELIWKPTKLARQIMKTLQALPQVEPAKKVKTVEANSKSAEKAAPAKPLLRKIQMRKRV